MSHNMQSSSGCTLVLVWTFSQVAQAYTTFEPECTNPKEAVNFVSSPPTRGTLDILWSSLFTIFACTWTILHLNVPEQRDDRDPGVRGDIKWKMKAFWGKAKWMLATVLAPEFLLFYAVSRFMTAREQHRRFKVWTDVDQVPWTISHTTFASMGGFVVRGSSDRVGKYSRPEIPTTQIRSQIAEEWFILDIHTILKLRSEGHIILPCIPTSEIDDHSNGDSFTKVIAAAQIIWTIANAITRACRGLAISQLEISVIAFSVCALLIYACYWSSPKDVSVPITFLQWREPIPHTITEIMKGAKIGQFPVGNDTIADSVNWSADAIAFILGSIVFSAPHLLAWNFTFPTPAERILWRATSVFCSSVGVLAYAVSFKRPTKTF